MGVSLVKYQFINRHPKVARPCDVFKRCPACKAELLIVDSDVLCSRCDWNSIEVHVEALLSAQAASCHGARAARPAAKQSLASLSHDTDQARVA